MFIMYEQFLYIFLNLFFSKTNNAKIVPLIIFCFHITIIMIITLKSNFIKKERYISYIFIHIYEYLCVFMNVYI